LYYRDGHIECQYPLLGGYMLDLRSLVRPATPNHYLVAPAGYGTAEADEQSPSYALSADELFARLRLVMLSRPRTKLIEEEPSRRAIEVRERTRFFRFPDDITAEVIAEGDARSTVAIYSRSRFGRSDLHANRHRVWQLLQSLGRDATNCKHRS
jgi:uncharacterized protein (DUF1499 family)